MSLALALVALTVTSTAAGGPVTMALQEGSSVRFTAHQTFSSTDGHFRRFDGRFSIDPSNLAASKIEVRIDAASIDTDNSDRDEHLRNPDFFEVTKYPKIVFESTEIAPKSTKGWVEVKGVLRVKDKRVPVAFDMQLEWKGDSVRAQGRLTVSRKALGLDYKAPFYIPSIKDKVNITLDARLAPPTS